MRPVWPTAISTEPLCTQLTPSSAIGARRERRHPIGVNLAHNRAAALDPLENTIGHDRASSLPPRHLKIASKGTASRLATLHRKRRAAEPGTAARGGCC